MIDDEDENNLLGLFTIVPEYLRTNSSHVNWCCCRVGVDCAVVDGGCPLDKP